MSLATFVLSAAAAQIMVDEPVRPLSGQAAIELPAPVFTGTLTVEKALLQRRSVREYSRKPLTLDEVSRLLWAAQGVTGLLGQRTAPSAGALYPLQVYLVVGDVAPLERGVYAYRPSRHALERISGEDTRSRLADAALGQTCVSAGAVVIVLTAIYDRTSLKYGARGTRYVHMEAGHAAQNIYLEAASLNLGTVVVVAFDDDRVAKILHLTSKEQPLAIMPVGRPR